MSLEILREVARQARMDTLRSVSADTDDHAMDTAREVAHGTREGIPVEMWRALPPAQPPE